jgi:hypothetical protein
MDTTLVVFTSNNARVLKNPDLVNFVYPNSVLNPDLAPVKGIPPHHWRKRIDGKIVPMGPLARHMRDRNIAAHGVDNKVIALPRKARKGLSPKTIGYAILALGVAGLTAYLIF